ncbi:MAG: Sec-independent protein translocase protein TatB [Rhodospirillaceae bacterium]|nr:Sec-independent protein translocase protein TatB [Rhodospirillaceae bacterium]
MFDIGWQEIFIIGILALIVVGPKDLPQAVRTISQWVRKARALASEFQGGVNEMIREAELDDIKKQITDVKSFDLQSELEKNIDPNGEIASGLGVGKGQLDPLDTEAEGLSGPSNEQKPDVEVISETYSKGKSAPVDGATDSAPQPENEPDDDVMPAGPVTKS